MKVVDENMLKYNEDDINYANSKRRVFTTNFTGARLLQFSPNSTLLARDAQCDEIHVRGSSNSMGYLMERLFILLFFHLTVFDHLQIFVHRRTDLRLSERKVNKGATLKLTQRTRNVKL